MSLPALGHAVVFIDVKFTTLDERHRRPWEIAIIHHCDGVVTEYVWMISGVDLAGASPRARDR